MNPGSSTSADALERDDIDALAAKLREAGQQQVTVAQTHVSWLIMAGRTVWKFKKPVRLPFCDFSTLALRRHFCEEEIRLNSRLAPQLYRQVTALWRDPAGVLSFSPEAGKVVEWAVEMVRFEDDALLMRKTRENAVTSQAMHTLGERIAVFHEHVGRDVPEPDYGSAGLIRREVEKLFQPLGNSVFAAQLPAWQSWLEPQMKRLAPLWRQRRAQGHVREGHGDLHMGNLVVLGEEVVAFDCLEFEPAMRWIDTASDIAFLTMDLQAHGHPELAARVQDGWLQQSGDFEALAVWRFYEFYRAMVRTMVAGLNSSSEDAMEAGRPYTGLLDRWSRPPAGPPGLYITCGLSGSGKSTAAARLMERDHAIRLRSDVERKRLFGLDARADSKAAGLNIYTSEASQKTFDRLARLSRQVLGYGCPVVVDGAFLHRHERARFRELARQLDLPFGIIWCDAAPDVLRRRIESRRACGTDASEATPGLIGHQQQVWEPFTEEEWPLVQKAEQP